MNNIFVERDERCAAFFNSLAFYLGDKFEVQRNRKQNQKMDMYLYPKGTKSDLTYYSKPLYSIRCASTWNWYADKHKCKDETIVQCQNIDMPKAKSRPAPGKQSSAVMAAAVGFYDTKKVYHTIYGEKIDPETGKWVWIESDPEAIANYILYLLSK